MKTSWSHWKSSRSRQPFAQDLQHYRAYINITLTRTLREDKLWSMFQENWISFYENELNCVHKFRQQHQDLG